MITHRRIRFSLVPFLILPVFLAFTACNGDDDDDDIIDMGARDTGAADTGAGDTGTADMGTADTGTGDTGTGDTGTGDTGTGDAGGPLVDLVATAQNEGLTSLLNVATAAGLGSTLMTDGPFTVFAPSNEAFTDLGGAAPTDPDLLANVLLHHVVAGEVGAATVTSTDSLTTLARTSIAVDTSTSPPTIGGAPLTDRLDVQASNGIIHVIDAVMIPPTIPEAVTATTTLSTLLAAIQASSQETQDLLASGPITVFAPVNSAFAGIDLGSLDPATLDAILEYHVVPSQLLSSDLAMLDGLTITTEGGGTLTVGVSGDSVTLTDAQGGTVSVTEADFRLLNGTVHLIDGVLMP